MQNTTAAEQLSTCCARPLDVDCHELCPGLPADAPITDTFPF